MTVYTSTDSQDPLDTIHRHNPQTTIEKKYNKFIEGIAELEKLIKNGKSEAEIEKQRKSLSSTAWDMLHLEPYSKYKVSEKKIKSLGIVPIMGKSIPRGQSGKDR